MSQKKGVLNLGEKGNLGMFLSTQLLYHIKKTFEIVVFTL